MNPILNALQALVIKRGVGLGGLIHEQRLLALAVAAQALRPGTQATEAQANAALQQSLAGPAAFLSCDHVELRRWLIDTGWWQRDGYGRCYQRVPFDALREELRPLAEALAGVELASWVEACRAAVETAREARRQAWQARRAA
ncbi:MAG: DUF2087 domain-containing protein [Rubrivivax sp.]|nr:DUF2087 domain-containing protein [Rubrivivax sp.]